MESDPGREALRRMMLERRDATSADLLEMASGAIRQRLSKMKPLRLAGSVGAYHHTGSEVRTGGIIQDILDAGQRLLLPAVSEGTLVFREVRDSGDMVRGRFGIMEPKPRCTPGVPEIVLVPAVCITLGGIRLGYGHGYYDGYLSANPIESAAITLEKQVVGRIPPNPSDVPVDWVVTEDRLHKVVV